LFEQMIATVSQKLGADIRALTNREREVAALVCRGLSNKTIAHQLSITEGTVKQYVHAIYVKLGVRSRYELIRRFAEFAKK
jgi:DNA-binding NarL/FixJ family response regulator